MSEPVEWQLKVGRDSRSRIVLSSGGSRRLAEWLGDALEGRRTVVVTDANVHRLYGESVFQQISDLTQQAVLAVLPAGEPIKSVDQLAALWARFADSQLQRDSVVLALGGGVIGDLAGMAAATYARGVRWIGLPTTLMAQVDSGIGGKVGVNLPSAKNLVGAFWQPSLVLVDPELLATLDEREYRSGMAEVVKYAVLEGPDAFESLRSAANSLLAREPAAVFSAVRQGVQCKWSIVRDDPWEQEGRRWTLNFGHTFAHALETLTEYQQLSHGEAVSIGMVCAGRLAHRLGIAKAEFVQRLRGLLEHLGLPTRLPAVDPDAMMQSMALDKKNRGGRLRFVLAGDFGKIELKDDIPPADVREVLLGEP